MVWNSDCTIALVVNVTLVVISMGLGLLMNLGGASSWRAWYRTLPKSRATPPDWVFSVVWPLLYAMIGAAGILARYYYEQPDNSTIYAVSVASLVMYYLQWAFNLVWSPIFFFAKAPTWALVILAVGLCASIAAMILFYVINWLPGLLMTPYVLWLIFAFYLNLRIVMKMADRNSAGYMKVEQNEEVYVESDIQNKTRSNKLVRTRMI